MSELAEVGTYVRDLSASLERLLENALDWEHLPHVHDGSFSAIRVIEHGPCGWRAEARLPEGRPVLLHLQLDGAAAWTTRTFAGERLLSEIRSRAEATGPDSCRVHVSFLASGIQPEKAPAIGQFYRDLYARLYDEDERLMIARAEAIARGPAALKERRPVALPDGTPADAPRYCPHQGLPLNGEPDADGLITCPWHGYLVDIRSGRATPPCLPPAAAGSIVALLHKWAQEPPLDDDDWPDIDDPPPEPFEL